MTDNTLDKILDEVSIDTGLSVGSLVHDDALKAIKQYIADREKKMLEFVEEWLKTLGKHDILEEWKNTGKSKVMKDFTK